MIEETLNLLDKQARDALAARRKILDWADQDEMTKAEWDGFVRYLVENASDSESPSRYILLHGGDCLYRTGSWVVSEQHGRYSAQKYASPMVASNFMAGCEEFGYAGEGTGG